VDRDGEAEERAAIQAEAWGEFEPPKSPAEHAADVAALGPLGLWGHRQVSLMISENAERTISPRGE
jgi:hypothetical protein